jgi:hypothetical protein
VEVFARPRMTVRPEQVDLPASGGSIPPPQRRAVNISSVCRATTDERNLAATSSSVPRSAGEMARAHVLTLLQFVEARPELAPRAAYGPRGFAEFDVNCSAAQRAIACRWRT